MGAPSKAYFLCLIRLGTYGLLIVRVCTLFRSSYSWVRWKNEAPTKLMKKNKNKKKLAVHTKMKSKYAHFGPFLRIFLRTFKRIFMRILVIIRDCHPKPTPHTLQTMDTPPSTSPPRCKGGELSEGRRISIAVEVALAIPPGKVRVPKGSMLTDTFLYPASVLVLVWFPQVSWF